MPLYEYHCEECDRQVEVLVRGSEKPHCPTCNSKKLSKLLSVPAAPNIQSGRGELPMCSPPASSGGCGLPQCGMGGCMMGDE